MNDERKDALIRNVNAVLNAFLVNCRVPPICVAASQLENPIDLVEAVRDEMVVTLADAVIRRTPMGALGCPDDGELTRAATIVGAELGWSPERVQQEIADVRRFYAQM